MIFYHSELRKLKIQTQSKYCKHIKIRPSSQKYASIILCYFYGHKKFHQNIFDKIIMIFVIQGGLETRRKFLSNNGSFLSAQNNEDCFSTWLGNRDIKNFQLAKEFFYFRVTYCKYCKNSTVIQQGDYPLKCTKFELHFPIMNCLL